MARHTLNAARPHAKKLKACNANRTTEAEAKEKVRLWGCETAEDEAEVVAMEIEELSLGREG